jgi:L-ascorbate metabolism protein UlaG (beta-lactamase superfamily)
VEKRTLDSYQSFRVPTIRAESEKKTVRVTSFGTSTLLFDDGEDQIMFDAFFTRPSFVRTFTQRISSNQELVQSILRKQEVDRLRAVFVSHSHYDHALDVATIANQTGAKVYGSLSTLNIARGGGVNETQLVEFQTHETYTLGKLRIQVLPSIHSKPAKVSDNLGKVIDKPLVQPCLQRRFYEGGSYAFRIEHGSTSFLIHPSFNYLPRQYKKMHADVLFVGIGGFGVAVNCNLKCNT